MQYRIELGDIRVSMFALQKLICQICGKEFETDFNSRGGYGREKNTCGKICYQEFDWRRTLAILGKPYYPDPTKAQ